MHVTLQIIVSVFASKHLMVKQQDHKLFEDDSLGSQLCVDPIN
jgi:hypothetical protein